LVKPETPTLLEIQKPKQQPIKPKNNVAFGSKVKKLQPGRRSDAKNPPKPQNPKYERKQSPSDQEFE
jgi:hypothetical protein